MFIAIVDFAVAPQNRNAALDALLAEAPVVRAMPGNMAFRAYLDPVKPDAVCIIHEWADPESFETYTASQAFKSSGEILRPLMTSIPVSRRMSANLLETVT